MARSRFIVGIDLGTTNCAVAYVDTRGREKPSADVKTFAVTQLVAPGEAAPRPMLPSFLYLPGPHELPAGAVDLPWNPEPDRAVGEFARSQGAKVPAHLVASAKSWLCHAGVDREAAILPWGFPDQPRKVSPVEASAEYLIQIRDAWDHQFAREDPALKLAEQEVIVTVPASFDEAAREFTVEACRRAGLTRPVLLEEPQAAFYCWIVTHQDGWQREVRAGEKILVCDVGGGTTDFSLISVVETPEGPGFRRVAVGDHLMLGGDNIDLALAHAVEKKVGAAKLDAEQWAGLRLACRGAKEKLLGDAMIDRWPVTVAGRGSKVIGGGLRSELTRSEVEALVVDGFFPKTPRGEEPDRSNRAGLREFGLPFVNDPAIPRHLAAFLRRHEQDLGEGGTARPDAILFNGGALTPAVLRDRFVDIVKGWYAEDPSYRPRVLHNTSLDLAVAIGAAYYGVVRRGGGIRIGGGTARSFYVGLHADGSAAPWLCVVPRDAEEGAEIAIEGRNFDLLMGQPVAFPLASSSIRAGDRAGDMVPDDPDSILALPPLVGVMRVGRKAKADRVPVRLASRVTEVGTVELWCESRTDDRRWKLQLQRRGGEGAASGGSSTASGPSLGNEADAVVIEQSEVDAALEAVRVAFQAPGGNDEDGPSRLVKRLEEVLDAPKDAWPSSALRALWEPLRDAAELRWKSPRHESRWYNLAGFCLRPGSGYPLDEVRVKALWSGFHQGVRHAKDMQCWTEWWVMWRRVAAGLNRAHHEEIHRRLAPLVLEGKSGSTRKLARPKPEAHELAEIWRCAASLERLPTNLKEPLGDALAKEIAAGNAPGHATWCLGRIGARVPLYGPANVVVPPEKAARWVEALLGLDDPTPRGRVDELFALAQMARVSGDRARDLPDAVRGRVADRLARLEADPSAIEAVREFREVNAGQQGQILGDALPTGLRLIHPEAVGGA